MMLRSILYRAALAFCLMSPAAASASEIEEARKHIPTVLADMHFADRYCTGFYVDLTSIERLAAAVLAPLTINDEPYRSAYLARTLTVEQTQLSERIGAICGMIWDIYGPPGRYQDGFVQLLPHIRFTPPDTFRRLLDHYAFDNSQYDKRMQSRMRSALGKVFDVCPGLEQHTASITAQSVMYADYGMTIDYEGAREPWGPMFQFEFRVADDSTTVPPRWLGHVFGVYVNDGMTEVLSTKWMSHELCGIDDLDPDRFQVIFLE